ncbi:DUF3566 domain-containing protein [Actinomadura barringtoniae]|nr:DUF3566 domain-containing protein [Actinomadura barringtoniae]
MSTQPGKGKGRSTGAGKGTGSASDGADKAEDTKPKKTSAASKPGRDEATVDIGPVKPSADETRTDLGKVTEPEKDAEPGDATRIDGPEIPPVKDTAPKDVPAAESPAVAPPPVSGPPDPPKDSPKESPSWAKPAEPGGSVSSGRSDKPFGRREVAGSGTPGPPAGSGFAGTALKDRPAPASSANPGPAKAAANAKSARKAQLQLARLEPWSVMKFSFVMSLVCFVVLLVAVVVLYVILSGLGVFDAISGTVNDLTREQGQNSGGLDAGSWFSFVRVFGYTVLVGALNVLLITALSTVGAVIYNLAADLVGGVEVTLKEAE